MKTTALSGSNALMREALHDGASHIIVTDLGYGDAGKGTVVDWLAREIGAVAVVRYNGGSQAGHNVVLPDGTHHEFAQFGAASFVPGVRTHLSRYMMVNPLNIFPEQRHLVSLGVRDAFNRLSIDEDALVITPFQRAANQLKEAARGDGRHGSCGQGIGETMSDFLRHGDAVVFARDLDRPEVLKAKLRFLQATKRDEVSDLFDELPWLRSQIKTLQEASVIDSFTETCQSLAALVQITDGDYLGNLLQKGRVIFEGAQGILLDEWYGFHPYTTWSTTTPKNARTLLHEQRSSDHFTLGVTRAYGTRHGPGPFVTEDEGMAFSEHHNVDNEWQRTFRQGYFDMVATRYAIEAAEGVDGIAVTCLDKVENSGTRLCMAYTYQGTLPDLHPYFDQTGSLITRLRRGSITDHAHNEALANRLEDCSPVYSLWRTGARDFSAVLEQETGCEVVLESWGPTFKDKVLPRVGVLA